MKPDITDRQIMAIALPSIVSNVTVPLLGMCDLAIAGHTGDATLVAAVSVGATLFNVLYWLFGFLRMGTGGLTSQAYGRGDDAGTVGIITRSILAGAAMSAVLLAVHRPLIDFTFAHIIETEPSVERLARTYISICIWGIPAMLLQYCFTGWFIGMQNSRLPMAVSILQNIINIAVSLSCVTIGGMTIDGIAIGTLTAQWSAVMISAVAWALRYGNLRRHIREVRLSEIKPMLHFLDLNKDIFLRTLCLVAVTLFFTSAGAAQGDMTVAANALLMQFFTIFSYIMDGLAYAAEALTGKHIGARDAASLQTTVRRIFRWTYGVVALFTITHLRCGIGRICHGLPPVGSAHSVGRFPSIRLGRSLHRCDRHACDAAHDGRCHSRIFHLLPSGIPVVGQQWPVDVVHHLPVLAGDAPDSLGQADHIKDLGRPKWPVRDARP